jgi:hypothetical protein
VLLLGVPGVGALFGLPTLHAAWLAGMALPGVWAAWHILRRGRPVAVAAH